MRVGWHLDDIPQPYVTVRRIAFAILVVLFAAACVAGVLLAFDASHGRSLALPLIGFAAVVVLGSAAGAMFGSTNKHSPRWREWRSNPTSQTPGWPSQ